MSWACSELTSKHEKAAFIDICEHVMITVRPNNLIIVSTDLCDNKLS